MRTVWPRTSFQLPVIDSKLEIRARLLVAPGKVRTAPVPLLGPPVGERTSYAPGWLRSSAGVKSIGYPAGKSVDEGSNMQGMSALVRSEPVAASLAVFAFFAAAIRAMMLKPAVLALAEKAPPVCMASTESLAACFWAATWNSELARLFAFENEQLGVETGTTDRDSLGPVGVLERSAHAPATSGKLAASTASQWRGTMERLLVVRRNSAPMK